MPESPSLDYRTQLAMSKEEAEEISYAVFLRNKTILKPKDVYFGILDTWKDILKVAASSKSQLKKMVTRLNTQRKKQIEKLVVNTNFSKYYVTEGGSPLLSKTYMSTLGLHGEGEEIKNVLDGN